MGACVVTEEHHVVFHVNGTCTSGFAPKEGEREGDVEVSYIPLWGVGCFAY